VSERQAVAVEARGTTVDPSQPAPSPALTATSAGRPRRLLLFSVIRFFLMRKISMQTSYCIVVGAFVCLSVMHTWFLSDRTLLNLWEPDTSATRHFGTNFKPNHRWSCVLSELSLVQSVPAFRRSDAEVSRTTFLVQKCLETVLKCLMRVRSVLVPSFRSRRRRRTSLNVMESQHTRTLMTLSCTSTPKLSSVQQRQLD